jgi:hypothetical protein
VWDRPYYHKFLAPVRICVPISNYSISGQQAGHSLKFSHQILYIQLT